MIDLLENSSVIELGGSISEGILAADDSVAMQLSAEEVQVSQANASNSVGNSSSIPKPDNFPFSNSSFPGDPDSDALPYPPSAARSCRQPKRHDNKQHFFLITSKEAVQHKEKQNEEQLDKERAKQEKMKQKAERLQKKENIKQSHSNKSTKADAKKQRNVRAVQSPMRERTNKFRSKKSTTVNKCSASSE